MWKYRYIWCLLIEYFQLNCEESNGNLYCGKIKIVIIHKINFFSLDSKRSMLTGQCKPKHFECTPGECIPSPWVCDGEEVRFMGGEGERRNYVRHKVARYVTDANCL